MSAVRAEPDARPTGMAAFTLVWIGQLISLVGTTMTQFALTIWAYQLTGQATALALVGFFAFAPSVIFSPFAGVLVDRWNRKLVMMISDLTASLAAIMILLLYTSGNLQLWHLYVAGIFTGIFQAFQWPAYSAAISTMLPKSQYTRASSMLAFAESGSGVVAPLLAGVLLLSIGIAGIMTLDLISYVVAIIALLVVAIPQPEAQKKAENNNILKEAGFGFRYILARPSLLGLQLVFFAINLIGTFGFTVLAPMILARTNQDKLALGSVQSAAGLGGVVGALLLSIWGGPKRKVHGVLLGMALSSLLGMIVLGLGQTVLVWAAGAFLLVFFNPLINGSNQAIWQSKVPPGLQGRVFSVRALIARLSAPVAMLIAGPLADRVFEPAMQPEGALAHTFGGWVGVGPGAGMALMFVITGALSILVSLSGYAFPAVRDAETILPDHDTLSTVAGI